MGDLRIHDFPDDLQRALKVEAAKRGTSLRSLVVEGMQEKLEQLQADPDGR